MMKVRLRQRAMRALYAAIISSDFTEEEIREIGDAMRMGDIAIDIALMLDQFSRQMRLVDRHDPSFRADDRRFSTAKDLMSSRKITKTMLSKMIAAALSAPHGPSTKASADEMLLSFLDQASDRDADKLIAFLKGEPGSDPYLDGIMKRQDR
jgi:hypothetical protein